MFLEISVNELYEITGGKNEYTDAYDQGLSVGKQLAQKAERNILNTTIYLGKVCLDTNIKVVQTLNVVADSVKKVFSIWN